MCSSDLTPAWSENRFSVSSAGPALTSNVCVRPVGMAPMAVGAAWAAACGFAGGWLLGVTHNLTMAAWMFAVRMRTELSQQRNFIDHLR